MGELNGEMVKIVIDTGSDLSYVNGELVQRMGWRLNECAPENIIFGNSDSEMVQTKIVGEIIVGEDLRKSAGLYVLNKCPVDVILGLDLLTPYEIYRLLLLATNSGVSSMLLINSEEAVELYPEVKDSEEEKEIQKMYERSHPRVRNVLKKFVGIFKMRIGQAAAKLRKLQLKLIPDAVISSAMRAPPRRRSLAEDADIHKQVSEMIDLGVIIPYSAPFHSQVHIVAKKDGSARFCIDYRQLNRLLESITWPLPNIGDLLNMLRGKAWFASLDLSSGYWQLELSEDSVPLTTFTTSRGTYAFKRCPFGLKSAPSAFQRAMAEALGEYLYVKCVIYIDDLLVFGEDMEEFIQNVEDVLQRLQELNIRVKPSKCTFGVEEVHYLGHVVSGSSIKMSDERKQLFGELAKPMIVTNLRSFLGGANFFRSHVANFASIATPLYELLQGKEKRDAIAWTEKSEEAFAQLRQAVLDAPTLYHILPIGEVILYCDASAFAIGGFISQIQDGIERPIVFMSRRLTDTEKNYSTIEREMLAINYCIRRAHVYLAGRKFLVMTDHKPLLQQLKLGDNARVERLKIALMEYEYEVLYIKGEENVVADTLSRVALLICNDIQTPSLCLKASRAAEIPVSIRNIIRSCHNAFVGHNGVARTAASLKSLGHSWKNMEHDIDVYIKACPICATVRSGRHIPSRYFRVISERPNAEWAMDSIGPLDADMLGNIFILVIVEMFSGFCHLRALKSTKADECAKRLEELFGHFGIPERFRFDNATQFTGNEVDMLLKSYSVATVPTVPYNSMENSVVEVRNREVRRHLAALTMTERQPWSAMLPRVQRILNSTMRSDMEASPAEILFGRFEALGNIYQMIPQENMLHLQDVWIDQIADKNIEKQRLNIEMNVQRGHSIQEGSYVYARNFTRRKSDVRNTLWQGPYFVLRVEGDTIVILGDKEELRRHVSDVKIFDNSLAGEDSDDVNEARNPSEITDILEVDLGRGTATSTSLLVKYAQIEKPIRVPLLQADFLDQPIFKELCQKNEQLARIVNSRR